MSKTIRNVYDKHLTFDSILEAHNRAKINKTFKKDVMKFEMDLESNIDNIYRSLILRRYHISEYKKFIIYEPKERVIMTLKYQDRVVHQWFVKEFIIPYFVPRFINDSYACIDNRGTHKAVRKVQEYMRIMKRKNGSYYVLQCDIRKFFDNIDKDKLFSLLKGYIQDKDVLSLSRIFIYDNLDGNTGIPIGNYTSQYFANIYLDVLDKYVKEKLSVKYYVRYMDDFVMLVKDKDEAKYLLREIRDFLNKNLKLELNHKSRYYPNSMGINFCGYRIFETHILLRVSSKRKIKKNIKKWKILKNEDRLDEHKLTLMWNSWVSHARHSDSYLLRNKLQGKIKDLI